MLRNLITSIILLFALNANSQATLYSANFEPPFIDWTLTGDLAPNQWIKSTCPDNGPSGAGVTAFHISEGGIGLGCGIGNQDQYSYTNSPSGVKQAIAYTTIVGNCASNLQATFDYRIEGVVAQDYAELIYSANGGASWIPVGGNLTMSATWTTTTISLPAGLNFSTFLLGIRFTYDNATINGFPIAIDNFKVTGTLTDAVNPSITCPISITQPVNASCVAFAADYTQEMILVSDNCTDSVDILVTQSLLEFTLIPVTPGNSMTVTLTAMDETGNTSQCSFTLNIVDLTPPVFTVCPGASNIYVDNNCDGLIANYIPLAIVNDNCPGTIFSQSPAAGFVVSGQMVVTPVTITATDPSGNFATCLFNTTTIDTILPTIICPPNQNIYANNSCQASLIDYTGMSIVDDNCVSNSLLTVSQSPVFGTFISANQIVTLTVSNGIPNSPKSCTFTVNLIDTVKPNVICPVPSLKYLNTSCETSIPDFTSALSWSDNCTSSAALMTFTQAPVGGTMTSTNQTVTLTAMDQAGNSRSCSVIQTVIDTIRPILNCPPSQTIDMNASCFATLPNFIPTTSHVENCFFITDVVYSQSPIVGTTINGVIPITMTGTDESGNFGTCSFTVTPIDVTNPTITCPVNATVSANSGCTYNLPDVSSLAVVTDNCTSIAALTFSQTPLIGATLPIGTHTISITVDDLEGNSASCNYQLTVVDQTIPIVTCPLAQSVSVDVNCSGNISDYTSLVTMSDNCSALAQLTISQSPTAGSTINGNTEITMTITDASSNVATCTFFAVVIDNIDPILTCPPSVNIAINSSCQYNIPDLSGAITGTDNCSSLANMTVSQNPTFGTLSTGLTAVLITLTDQNGNDATCITMMTPFDTEAPIITCPSPAPINNGVNCDYTLINFASIALVNDNCPGFSITQTPAPGVIVQTGTQPILLEVMDAGGNIDQCTFNITVIEGVMPTISCPSNISTCNPLVTYTDPTFNDNCFAFLTQTDMTGFSSGDVFPIGITTLTYAVEDSSSNTQTCSFQIEVLDFPSPASILVDSISLCDITSSVIEAIPVTSGIGEWTVISGQGTFNNQFANLTGVNNLGYDTNVFVWTISSASCGNTSDTVTIIVSHTPLAASTLDTVYACNSFSFDLSANVPLYGIGTWSTNLGATISDVNLATASASNLTPGWNQFIWLINSGSCPSTSDTMQVYSAARANINEQDTILCLENQVFALNGTFPAINQTSTWAFISGSGLFADFNSPSTTIENLGIGTNMVVYKLEHELCNTTADTITIVTSLCNGFDPIFPTVITPNLDGKNDLFVINYLEKVYPSCRVIIFNRWGSIVFESIGYKDPWNGTFKGEELPMGTYFYKIELNDEDSTVFNGPISIIR
jgi:gliding motility-associated-like protein